MLGGSKSITENGGVCRVDLRVHLVVTSDERSLLGDRRVPLVVAVVWFRDHSAVYHLCRRQHSYYS